jgi:hypothetical protein
LFSNILIYQSSQLERGLVEILSFYGSQLRFNWRVMSVRPKKYYTKQFQEKNSSGLYTRSYKYNKPNGIRPRFLVLFLKKRLNIHMITYNNIGYELILFESKAITLHKNSLLCD